jgi:hypothetical protein
MNELREYIETYLQGPAAHVALALLTEIEALKARKQRGPQVKAQTTRKPRAKRGVQ